MDKNAIKKFAVWARRELIARVSQKAEQYGITDKGCGDARADRVNGQLLSAAEQKQRLALCIHIDRDGYRQVMEEAAYTWFNRFIALRFMEVNGYLPTRIRVFTNEENAFKPQIIDEAIHMELDGLDMEKVYALIEQNRTEALYKYLLITQCNALSSILPGMFQKIADYTELLFPDNLLRDGSVIEQMIALIPEEGFKDQVQIIGWLYQYYNSEPKDQVFANLKKNIKISKHDIPAATQLFTPDWIVRYMVENSLGRLWVEGHPDEALQSTWKYYLPEAEQEPQVQTQLNEIRKAYAAMKPEDIKCIDPCMGSGHILCYLFDVLMQIYEAYGYSTREAVQSILENNLYGLDIDDRAAQLAYFAVMMKARQYDRRFFNRGIQPHVMAIQESNPLMPAPRLSPRPSPLFKGGVAEATGVCVPATGVAEATGVCVPTTGVTEATGDCAAKDACYETMTQLINTFRDAKEYGSILDVEIPGLDTLDSLMEQLHAVDGDFELTAWIVKAEALLPMLAKQAEIMGQKYDMVVTNPPYMGASGMGARLNEYVKARYPDSKSDLFAVFMERCGEMAKPNGYQAMITQHAWMFLSSFEKLRLKLMQKDTVSMAHLGARAFEEIGGEVVQTTSFVMRKSHVKGYKGSYCRLIEPTTQQGKEDMFLAGVNRYTAQQDNFAKIPGSPVAYWVSERMQSIIEKSPTIKSMGRSLQGTVTGDNERFMRIWFEVATKNSKLDAHNREETLKHKWLPYCKGGEFRRWYGNMLHVIDWENNGWRIRNFRDKNGKLRSRPQNIDSFFKRAVTWSSLTSGDFGARLLEAGCTFSDIGPIIQPNDPQTLNTILGYINTKVFQEVLDICCSGLHYQNGVIAGLPCFNSKNEDITESISDIVENCVSLSRADWDSFETSWDFRKHPLVQSPVAAQAQTIVAGTQTPVASATPPFKRGLGLGSGEKMEFLPRDKALKPFSRELRTNATRQENHLWYDFLKDVKPRFTRQRIIGRYIADFFCYERMLVVELDGSQHYEPDAMEYDRVRTEYLNSLGITVLRFSNHDVDSNFEGVCTAILSSPLSKGGVAEATGVCVPVSGVAEATGVCPRESAGECISDAFAKWEAECLDRFNRLKANEEELNRIFIYIYGLQDELTPDVADKDVTVRKADLQRDIKSLISYAVGCMFGRYSLDVEGLAYAGDAWDASKYQSFIPDKDGILPICDDEYFRDDIVGRFIDFVRIVYGAETLEENLKFIADALGGSGTSREVIRSYFLNDFYADHLKIYQKRPIYWLFDSGKKNGFKCLIYMHRYAPDTIARIRTDYVHEQQSRYRTAIHDLENRVASATATERVKLQKQLTKLRDQAEEVRVYEEKIHHYADQMIAIDLDNGVKVNYAKFEDVLAKIK